MANKVLESIDECELFDNLDEAINILTKFKEKYSKDYNNLRLKYNEGGPCGSGCCYYSSDITLTGSKKRKRKSKK